MINHKYMIGTRFYRYDNNGRIEEIRLKEKVNNSTVELYKSTNGYRDIFITPEEFTYLYNHKCIKKYKNTFIYSYTDIHDKPCQQKWQLIEQGKCWHKFRIQNDSIYINADELEEYYTKLVPDGFIVAGIIHYKISGSYCKDIILTFHKNDDQKPSIICRQDINNPYNDNMIGGSISTTKLNFDSSCLLACDKMTCVKYFAAYADDTINTILHYLSPVKKYNQVLARMHDRDTRVCTDMYQFLNRIGFYADFADLFGIGLYPFKLSLDTNVMTSKQLVMFNGLFSTRENRFDSLTYEPYTHSIDITTNQVMPIRIVNAQFNDAPVVYGDLFAIR